MAAKAAGVVALALVASGTFGGEARAAARCGRVVVVAVPGVTWQDVQRWDPPSLRAAAARGAVASMSVRTIAARTSYGAGFATIGAGSRIEVGPGAGATVETGPEGPLRAATVPGVADIAELAEDAGYGARPGALGAALEARTAALGNADLGSPPPAPVGWGRWTGLAAMDPSGEIARAATGSRLLVRDATAPWDVRTDPTALWRALRAALRVDCSTTVVDQGDLIRAEQAEVAGAGAPAGARARALGAADELVGRLLATLDPSADLMLVVSPTSPAAADETHLGIAIAVGPGFPPGDTLESASTRRRGIVTLPDVGPTALAHLGEARPASMTGRPIVAADPARADRIQAAIDLDREAVFVGDLQSPLSTAFVVLQVLVYLVIGYLLFRRERKESGSPMSPLWHHLELAALGVVVFPVCTYLGGVVDAHRVGAPAYVTLLVALDVALVAVTSRLFDDSFDRLLALTAFTTAVIYADLVFGARLQLNTVFGYSPIVGGRFAGAGNIVFAALGASTLLAGVLIVHRRPRAAWAFAAAAALYGMTVLVDGAPQFGSDVGGVIALVPAYAVTLFLLTGRRPTWKLALAAAVAALAALALFLVVDLSRPPEARTHLARLYEDVTQRGAGIFIATVARKAEANLRVFRTSIWTFFVPPALGVLAWLLRRPRGRWQRLAHAYPILRAGLLGGLVLAVIGFAVNDSGIVVPAVVLSFLVPMALITHIALEREGAS